MFPKLIYKRSRLKRFAISFCSIGLLLILIATYDYRINVREEDNYLILSSKQILSSVKREKSYNQELVADLPMNQGSKILILSFDGKILAASDTSYVGKTSTDLGFDMKDVKYWKCYYDEINNEAHRCYFIRDDGLVIGVVRDISYRTVEIMDSVLFSFIFLILIDVVITILMGRNNLKISQIDEEKDKQLERLSAIANIYNSMHLINLDEDTIKEISSNDSIRRLADPYNTATEQMRAAMSGLIVEKYRDRALEFTNVNTVAERLKGKKMIYDEFLGINLGWIRSSFIPITFHDDGTPILVFYTTLAIDAEKRKELALLYKSTTDELTKLLNRHSYEDAVKDYEKRGLSDKLTLVMMDVNGLKKVNDSLGHAAGDELLIGACKCMNETFSTYGKVYRLGGDEFAAILDSENYDIDSLIQEFNDKLDSWTGDIVKNVSVSTGYAKVSEYWGLPLTEIEKKADERMYLAKKQYYAKCGVDRRDSRGE